MVISFLGCRFKLVSVERFQLQLAVQIGIYRSQRTQPSINLNWYILIETGTILKGRSPVIFH